MEVMSTTPNLLRMKYYCPTRTCENPYVLYLIFTDEGPRYRSATLKGRIDQNRTTQRRKS
jgi:hypothetical protein